MVACKKTIHFVPKSRPNYVSDQGDTLHITKWVRIGEGAPTHEHTNAATPAHGTTGRTEHLVRAAYRYVDRSCFRLRLFGTHSGVVQQSKDLLACALL